MKEFLVYVFTKKLLPVVSMLVITFITAMMWFFDTVNLIKDNPLWILIGASLVPLGVYAGAIWTIVTGWKMHKKFNR